MSQVDNGRQAHLEHALGRSLAVLRKAGADALIAASPANVRYLTGSSGWTHSMHITNQTYVVLTADGKKTLVMPSTDGDFLSMYDYAVDEVRTFGTFFIEAPEREKPLSAEEAHMRAFAARMISGRDSVQALCEALEAAGLSRAKLLLDSSHMMVSTWRRIEEALPKAEVVDGFLPLLRARAVKSEYEIELLRRSSACTEAAIVASLQAAAAGATDVEIRSAFQKSLADAGAEHVFSAVGGGTRTCFPNVLPNGTRLAAGEVLRYDVGCRYQGYASDLARNALQGEPPAKLRQYYTAMLNGEEAGLQAIRPGARAGDVFEAAMTAARKSGVPHYRRHHCGHAIGLDVYEAPVIRADDPTPLEAGMTFCIETPYYELGFGGVQVEDMVVVRPDGFELLTALNRDLLPIAA